MPTGLGIDTHGQRLLPAYSTVIGSGSTVIGSGPTVIGSGSTVIGSGSTVIGSGFNAMFYNLKHSRSWKTVNVFGLPW
jgi:hypothetical protein